MGTRLWSLFRQDLTIAFRNRFHWAILFLAALFIVLINFAIPEQVKTTPSELFYDATEDRVLEAYLREEGVDEDRLLTSREELLASLAQSKGGIGIIMEGSIQDARFTIIHQGTESPEMIRVLDAVLETVLAEMGEMSRPTSHRLEYLRPVASPPAFNKSLIPVFMTFEVVMFGFILIAVMVFQEKQEGSIRALRVSPAGILEYILAKAGVNVVLALAYGAMIVLFTMGLRVEYGKLFLLIILTSFLMTVLGLLISVFFSSLSEFLFVAIAVMLLISLPIVSYLYPSFAPAAITWIPAYPVVFGAREILFPTGKVGFLGPLALTLALEGAVVLAATYLAVGRKLMREGR